jgi:hypothetical protein
MQKILLVLLLTVAILHNTTAYSQKLVKERKGFIVGLGIGAGTLTLNKNDSSHTSFSTTIPNIKFGYMLNKRLALLVMLPGSNYKYIGKDRGFEGFILSAQYWAKDNWWVLGGTGITFDAPAFYTVKDPKTAGFYTGIPAFSFATGYEVWKKGRFALDLQYRIYMGQSQLPNNQVRTGVSNMLIIGFNWY